MKNHTIDKDLGFKKIIEATRQLKKKPYVKTGLMGTAKHQHSDMSVVEVGIIHEFGAPGQNIPERSFMRTTFDDKKESWWSKTKKLKQLILSGRMTVSKALDSLGMTLERDHKSKILTQDPRWPELKTKTIERKKSSKKLIDTAQMVNSITYKKVLK